MVGAGASVVLASAPARAECPLSVDADAPSSAWTKALDALRARLVEATGDCASVDVVVTKEGGAVTFRTRDGRTARRAVGAPEELGPTVEALLVSPEPPAPLPSPAPSAPPAPPAAPASPDKPVPSRGGSSSREVHFDVAAVGGGRLGLAGAYAAPSAGLRPSGRFGAWELGGAVEYVPTYVYLPGGLPSGVSLWSFSAAIQIGRRESLGVLSLGYGAGVGVAALREEAADATGAKKVADFGQPRVSAYGRASLPRESRWRGTLDLGLDAGLGSIKRRATSSNDLPDLPRWGGALAVGVEVSLL